jgi:hypothetical protein
MSGSTEGRERGETGSSTDQALDDRLAKSEVFEILSAHRRQVVLRYLDRVGGRAKLSDLAEHIASIECDCKRGQVTSRERKRAYVGLYQCHLPKMADMGAIDYDRDRGTVELNDRSVRLLKYLYFEEEGDQGVWEGILDRWVR